MKKITEQAHAEIIEHIKTVVCEQNCQKTLSMKTVSYSTAMKRIK